jgi:predicted enzyme related to lactoylglutathione lyase
MSTAVTFSPGKFVWFEHMSSDMDKAQAFYQKLFGWSTQAVPMGSATYPMVQNGGQGIGGYRMAAGAAPTHWICFMSVADVDASFKAIEALGCRTLQSPIDYGPGRMAAVADPTGAPFAMWKGTEGDPADAPVPVGGWHWTELWTTDEQKALAFYRRVFGYSADTMTLPDGGKYHLLTIGGVPRAGLMQAPGRGSHSMWLPYVSVEDCDATFQKALSLGSKQLLEPTDMPKVGRFAIATDPLGAPIGMIKVTAPG